MSSDVRVLSLMGTALGKHPQTSSVGRAASSSDSHHPIGSQSHLFLVRDQGRQAMALGTAPSPRRVESVTPSADAGSWLRSH